MIRINDRKCKATLKAAAVVSVFLLFVAVAGFGQQINLTAAPTTTTLPDGTTVPMWGYFCGSAVTGSTATCAALNYSASVGTAATWSPVVITVPTGQGLTINLTNNLSFTPITGSTIANKIPTSIVITEQVGGGLGNVTQRTTAPSPSHADAQGCPSWFIASNPPGVPCTAQQTTPPAIPPTQGPRVQSMATEVAAGTTTALTWPALRPGTYLLESGTHPSIQVPMGLIGVLVVTTAPSGATAGVAYPGVAATPTTAAVPAVQYNAEVPLEFSEIDPVQNKEVDLAVRTAGFSETAVWTRMNAFGPVTALTLGSGGSGFTSAPSVMISGGAGSGATATATVGALISAINVTAGGTGYTATPTVTISDSTGTGATATATVVGGVVTAITVTNPGSLYTAPTVSIGAPPAGGTQATATAATVGSSGVIYALNLTNAGAGFTAAPAVTITGGGGTGALATASITLGGCGGGAHTCYPPAVNYTPFYYLINGLAFNKTNAPASLFPATAGLSNTVPPSPITTGIPANGTVLVRLVNAGLRMHVPSIVGSQTTGFTGAGVLTTAANPVGGFTLIAEDGNVIPGVAFAGATTVPAAPRVQTDVFMAAGKTFDVMINVPAIPNGATATPALPIYDRELSLSGNSSDRDAGMLAYISVNNANPSLGLPVAQNTGVFAAAKANNDTYNSLVAGQPFSVSDPAKGVIANDVNVYGVTLLTAPINGKVSCGLVGSPTSGTICANGTFTYTPNAGSTATSDTFTYCANNGFVPATGTTAASCSAANLMATVTLGGSSLSGNPGAINQSYTAKTATYLKIPSPGLLLGNSDPSSLALTVVTSPAPTIPGGTVTVDSNGGFTASIPSHTGTMTAMFTYTVQNSQGRQSTPGTVTITFPSPSNLQVNVVDAQAYNNCQGDSTCISGITGLTDYRWIIEEDKTFWVDPNCTTNSSINTPGCPSIVGPSGQSTIPTFGVNFHTSHMEFVAQGCTGPLSCEGGQTMLDNRPACTAPGVPAGCSATAGQHIPAVCDLGNGACRPDTTGNGFTPVLPSSIVLDPTKRYYISVLPGDAANPFPSYTGQPNCTAAGVAAGQCGHTMSGAQIPPACNVFTTGCTPTSTAAFAPVTVLVLPTPLPTGKLSIMVFEDDFPLNGEQDPGGGTAVLQPNEPGLGGFNIVLWDTYGGLGDVTGQDTYDVFNMPLSNGLAGLIDPVTGFDACPISANSTTVAGQPAKSPTGITGMIVTCPKYESDGATLSPLAGQAVISNLMPDKFSVQAYPGADRIARGEEWLQTNTLDGQHPHDSFIRIGEPGYFQEFGPAGYHVSIGFANPAIINARHDSVCAGAFGPVGACTGTVKGQVDVQRLSRTPDQRLYPSGSRDALSWTQCWVSLGDPDAEDFMFTKCDANGNFQFTKVPGGDWRITIGDQWNDQIIDGLSTPANVVAGQTLDMGKIGVQQWQSNIYTRTFIDDNKNGIPDSGEIGIPFLSTMVYYRNGSRANTLVTDFNGIANFNETFPLFNWYVVESDTTRYKTTGIHTVYDAGGPADGSPYCGPGNGARACGTSQGYKLLTNTYEAVPLPADLSVPGAVYCAAADCTAEATSFAAGTAIASSATASTGRIDPPWVAAEGWSGETSQGNWIEFGKAPYAACNPALPVSATNFCATVTTTAPGSTTPTTTQVAENGGIHGDVGYASTRPFDDASQMIQQPWQPEVPNVTINLYQEGFAADGVTPTLKLVDTTKTSSWDDWAQGFYPNSTAGSGTGAGQKPYMSCPGQGTATGTNADLFYFTLFDQPNYLDFYNSQHNGGTLHTLPYNSQYKCYDAMHIWNQVQPAVRDGKYSFPSSLGIDPTTGKPLTTSGSTNGVSSNMPGTNCTICVPNPDTTDVYRVGTPMLPPGKYVVEVVMPPGYEVEKEEDKNLLIGDNFIAPVTQQFAGLGDIFIIPDQASVASLYDPSGAGYNPNNFQNETTSVGMAQELSANPGFPGFADPLWPCVGEMRVVPDYLSLFPQAKEVAPFAGATRPLCDRKEVTLANQMGVSAKFYIYTSTHIASKFTGVITDDFTSEFDPFSPQFGEKFAPPNLPVSTRDYLGNEISRVYSDHFGAYEGLTFSSWEVNPPNITGYSPTMMVQCMDDAGPVKDTNSGSPTFGQMINDPLYNAAYSNFCYVLPYMPGLTGYLDTPVVPTEAFVGAGYNNVDCAYPDTTPAIKEVDGDGVGPWVSAAGHNLTITALGDQMVTNYGYGGPSAHVAPFNAKTVTRHYGFGAAQGTVMIDGKAATVGGWSDTQITVAVPNGVTPCAVQQQAQYGGSTARCGELVITSANGKRSVDTVTVTIGGKAPTHVAASGTIQSAIDAAAPGDLIIVDPTCTTGTGAVPCTTGGAAHNSSTHTEMLIMWKPVRLQGVGAASTILNANTHPAGKLLDPWRRHIDCLFGLTLDGVRQDAGHPYDKTATYKCPDAGWNNFAGTAGAVVNPQVDRLPLEAVLGWDAGLNGNLAELLQEPTLLGAYEGAGITVLGRGLDFHGQDPFDDGAYPTGTTLLQDTPGVIPPSGGVNSSHCADNPNPYPSNFMCNPSSIDGLGITNSSQGGGGIFVHGWAHNLQIANNRVYNNTGTLSGGMSIGQGEFAPAYIQGSAANADPGSCQASTIAGRQLPYCLNLNVNVHNNSITQNSSIGDELFSATLAGGGGATFCTGDDYYMFNYNWVCGNLSPGEGGGLAQLGFIYHNGGEDDSDGGFLHGGIEHNSFLFNQSSNPTIPTNGGGIVIEGTPDTDPVCSTQPEQDCPPGLSDGTGPGLHINANLIQGNSADSGSGGGIRLQQVNGTEVSAFPAQPENWYDVRITNNIIVNNMAGWDGAGISLQDALNVRITNNTIAHNDTLASSGVLTFAIGTPLASAPPGECHNAAGTTSCPQSAGLTSMANSTLLNTSLTGLTIECPDSQPNCAGFSNPRLDNNLFWQNRSFYIGVGNRGSGTLNQQNLVSLFDAFTSTLAPAQTSTGACSTGVSYWDIGVRGDTGPSNHSSGFTLRPRWSVLTDAADYPNGFNSGSDPAVVSQYCNGSRVPPECTATDGCGGLNGFGVPPGIADAVTPNPVFSLVPSATVDEGNNWINVSWGPLSLTNPAVTGGPNNNYGGGAPLGNYALSAASQAIDYVPISRTHPALDFFGNPRPDPARPNCFDVGAVEFPGLPTNPNGCSAPNPILASITPTSGIRGTSFTVTLSGSNLINPSNVTVSGGGVTVTNVTPVDANTVTATFTISMGASINSPPNPRNVTYNGANGTATLPGAFTVVPPTVTLISPNSALRGSVVTVDIYGSGLSGATNVCAGGGGFCPAVPAVGGVGGITTSNIVIVDPGGTHIQATFTISPTAFLSTRNVSVATTGGAVTPVNTAVTFTVLGPTVTGITPTSGTHGTSVLVTITGTGLTGATGVTAGGGSITASNIIVTNGGSTLMATFTISNGAARTTRNVRVQTPIGQTPVNTAVTFTVN